MNILNKLNIFEQKKSNNFVYKSVKQFDERKKESNFILSLNQSKVPIIIEPYDYSDITDKQYIKISLNIKYNALKLFKIIKSTRKLSENESIYLYTSSNKIVKGNELINNLYSMYKDDDGYLYLKYNKISAFGSVKIFN